MAEGRHPFPFRTRKLSPPAPMVLSGQPGGRVGRCRASLSLAAPSRVAGLKYLDGRLRLGERFGTELRQQQVAPDAEQHQQPDQCDQNVEHDLTVASMKLEGEHALHDYAQRKAR